MTGVHGVTEGRLHDKRRRRQGRWEGALRVPLYATLQWWVERSAFPFLPETLSFGLLASLLLLERVFELGIHGPKRALALLIRPTLNLLERSAGGEVMAY